MLIETHAHLNFPEFKNDIAGAIYRAKKIGVFKIINIGTNLETSFESINLARKYPEIYATVGLHPQETHEVTIEEIEKYFVLLSKEKVVALGEIGLDFYTSEKVGKYSKYPSKEEQRIIFIQMLKLAQDTKLPVILHCRDAYEEMIKILISEGIKIDGVIHCFSSNLLIAKKFLDLGFHLSFCGNITYKKIDSINDVVREIPLSKILLETDSPYLTPEPFRGKRNEPAYILEITKKVAEIKKIPLVEVEKKTTENAEKLFKL